MKVFLLHNFSLNSFPAPAPQNTNTIFKSLPQNLCTLTKIYMLEWRTTENQVRIKA